MTALMGFYMHYYQHHIGDFIKDTSFLTNEEVGIYMKLLWLYYDTEKPLPNSLFELSMKVNARENKDAISGLLEMFFVLEDDKWHHKRCDKEIHHFRQQLETASRAGKASAAKRMMNKGSTDAQRPFNDRSTDVQPTNNQQPITNNQEPKKSPKGLYIFKPPQVDDDVWQAFQAIRKAKRSPITQIAMDGIEREAVKAGLSINDALKVCAERGWQGFKADWYSEASVNKQIALEERNRAIAMEWARSKA